jgi:hypothetical protein
MAPKGKGQSDFSDWPLFMPATTAVYPVFAAAPSEAEGEVERPSRVGILRVGRTFLSDAFEFP